ncbi:hypothetical protein OAU26_03730 [Mariniblastus sp.]|nr:hypothetical protein [Mariniblastus sp.]
MIASLTGLYPGNKCPSLKSRQRLFLYFTMGQVEFQQWLRDGHQSLCLFVIKEYLCWCATASPAVAKELLHRYKWNAFSKSVGNAMDRVRLMLSQGKTFTDVDTFLLHVNRSQVRHMFRQRKNTFTECLDSVVQREVVAEGADIMYKAIVCGMDKKILSQFSIGAQLISMRQTYAQTFARSSLKTLIRGLTPDEQAHLRLYVNMVKRANSVRVFNLHKELRDKQMQAVCRLYQVESAEYLPRHAGCCALCQECKTFKSFVSNPRYIRSMTCYGHSKVLVCDQTLKLYCGRKNEAKGKDSRCSKTQILEVNLIGRVLQFWGNLYTICQECGSFHHFDSRYYSPRGVYCGLCLEDGVLKSEHSCLWCHSKKNLSRVTTTTSPIRLCKKCYRPWIRGATTLLTVNTIKQGLREKWRNLPG